MADEKQFASMLDLKADTEELLAFNPEADANAMLPPVPAGRYFATIAFQEEDPEKRWVAGLWGKDAGQQKVYYTGVVATLYNTPGGLYDGRQVRDGVVSTYVMRNTGTCGIQGVLQCVGIKLSPSMKTRPALVQALNDALTSGNASGEIEVDWEAAENLTTEERNKLKADGKKAFRFQGMKRFPIDPSDATKHIPVVNHLGTDYRAYNIISRYVTASDDAGQQVEEAPAPVAQQTPRRAAPAPRASAPIAQQQTQSVSNGGPPVPPATQAPRALQGPRVPPRGPVPPPRTA